MKTNDTSNLAPVATAQSVNINYDTATSINLTGSDEDNDSLTYLIVTNPVNGILSGSIPNLTFTPSSGYIGSDSFTFKINDGKIDSEVVVVSLTVLAPPPTIYFCDKGSSLWADSANWYLTPDCTSTPLLRVPANLDIVVIQIGTFTDKPSEITLTGFTGSPSYVDVTANINIAANGTLSIVDGFWYGSSEAGASVNFGNNGANFGVIHGNASFVGTYNIGLIEGEATFDAAANFAGGSVLGGATFANSSSNQGSVGSTSTFSDSSNSGTVDVGIFSGTSSNFGTVNIATFNDNSTNFDFNGSAGFGTTSVATFNGNSSNAGFDINGVFQQGNNGQIYCNTTGTCP